MHNNSCQKNILFYVSILLISLFCLNSCSSNLIKQLKLSNINSIFRSKKNKQKLIQVWSKNLDSQYDAGNLPIYRAGSLLGEYFVYAAGQNQYFYAYDRDNGREVWKKSIRGQLSSMPAIDSTRLYFGTNLGRFYSLNKITGVLNFDIDLKSAIISKPVVYLNYIFIRLNNHKIVALDKNNGKLIWAYTRSISNLTTIDGASTPIISNGKLLVGFADGFFTSFRIKDGVLNWETKLNHASKFIDIDVDSVILNNKIYTFSRDGNLYILNIKNGSVIKKILIYPSALALKNGNVYVGTKDGSIVIIKNMKIIERKIISKSPLNSIDLSGEDFFVSDNSNHIYILNTKLHEKWSKNLGHPYSIISGKVNIKDNLICFMTTRQKLYVYKK